ncbi:hypothetical protein DFP72DRAFT_1102787 [Ephemerocybe angulata]|uniref:Uncharacterized protein n=1 Tax=Ephemerocybe angulata TaxID=980116 RepID=A0A8H6LTB9_9AGAR|nr:hypothetical protein DFP72DRAFT_1102787 [Tulosesus angulatus]
MPPNTARNYPQSRVLTSTGPKQVAGHPSQAKQRREYVEKPTTTHALVLRNAKHQLMGAGELGLSSRITGREKLDLLSGKQTGICVTCDLALMWGPSVVTEELIVKREEVDLTPFHLDKSLRIAESKYRECLDQITQLRDPQLFQHMIQDEITARSPISGPGFQNDPASVASLVGTRIHNTYMIASAWKIINDNLKGVAGEGITDTNVKTKLKADVALRKRYLVLYDMVGKLVDIFHKRVSALAPTSPHYSKYFRTRPPNYAGTSGATEFCFDLDERKVRAVTSSFLDCIIVELFLPGSKIPSSVLYNLLHDVIQESPGQAKRFTQYLWDAIGDLSFAVQLQTILESALLGPDEKAWKEEPRHMPEEYERWIDAYLVSIKATENHKKWKDTIFPLSNTAKKEVLDGMWKNISLNYKSYTGEDIDSVWQLKGAFTLSPQWSSHYVEKPPVNKPTPLALPKRDNASDSSFPILQSVSDTSESSIEDSDDSDSDDESDTDDYDEEQEDTLRELLREALDAGHAIDWYEATEDIQPSDLDPFGGLQKYGNPFMSLLRSLRGRFLSSSSKLKAETHRTEARRGTFPATRPQKHVVPKVESTPEEHEISTQEIDGEDDADEGDEASNRPGASKKKKKKSNKKKKKKKKKKGTGTVNDEEAVEEGKPLPSISSASTASRSTMPAGSTQATANQSPSNHNEHTSSRPAKPSKDTPGSSSLLSKLKGAIGIADPIQESQRSAKYSWFSQLGSKARGSMHKLLNSADSGNTHSTMQWTTFLKLMKNMGFTFDPCTAGSGVRFDPPDKGDRSITIYKPHPRSTLSGVEVTKIGKRLKRYYGWTEDDFKQSIISATSRADEPILIQYANHGPPLANSTNLGSGW